MKVSTAMLRVEHVTKRFNGNTALDDVTFGVEAGELTAVIGPNGAGKTTLLDAISGLISIEAGRVMVNDVDLTSHAPSRRARAYLERTFQKVKLADSLLARQNIMLHVRRQSGTSLLKAVALRGRWRDEERRVGAVAESTLTQLGLEDLATKQTDQLSFGQRKLMSFCGALVARLPVLIFDEPFTGVDQEKAQRVATGLRQLASEHRHVVFVEHNLSMVAHIASRVLALDRGRVIADGPPGEVLQSSQLAEAYVR